MAGMAEGLELRLGEARRLAVRCQHLAGPAPEAGIEGMRRVLRGIRVLQIDPVNVVARSHLLVLWSRLGRFDLADLDTLLWRERWLFEYWGHAASIVLAEDYPIHSAMMRAYPAAASMRQWLEVNAEFRRYVLDQVRARGPLPGEAIEDRAAVGWASSGWTNGRNVERMLHLLWKQGAVTVAGRDGPRRLWAPAERDPWREPALPPAEVTALAAEHALRALGVARARDIERHFIPERYGGLDLASYPWARPVRVEGGDEQWWVHRDVLPLLDEEWRPRTTLLSPFDNLICDRARTDRLWSFTYVNEMYKPKHQRRFGYYVLPVLSGERLIGRIAPRVDRKRGVLVVEGAFPEPGAELGEPVREAVESLAAFAGARSVVTAPTASGVATAEGA
jgi:uncharacterized protein